MPRPRASGTVSVSSSVSKRMLQGWLGHAQLSTTAICANAIDQEEQSIAAWMWS